MTIVHVDSKIKAPGKGLGGTVIGGENTSSLRPAMQAFHSFIRPLAVLESGYLFCSSSCPWDSIGMICATSQTRLYTVNGYNCFIFENRPAGVRWLLTWRCPHAPLMVCTLEYGMQRSTHQALTQTRVPYGTLFSTDQPPKEPFLALVSGITQQVSRAHMCAVDKHQGHL